MVRFFILSALLAANSSAWAGLPDLNWEEAERLLQDAPAAQQSSEKPKPGKLTTDDRVLLDREFFGKRGIAKITLPRGRDDGETIDINVETGPDLNDIRQTRMAQGVSIRAGAYVQVTGLKIEKNLILIDLNGGGPKRKGFFDGAQLSGGLNTTTTITPGQGSGGNTFKPNTGVTLKVCFDAKCGKRVPSLTVEELQATLAPLVDFKAIPNPLTAKPLDSVPEQFKKAVSDGLIKKGMDADAVDLALEALKDPSTQESIWGPPMSRGQVWDSGGHYFLWKYRSEEKYLFIYFDLKGFVSDVKLALNGTELCYPSGKRVPEEGCPPW